MTQPDSYETRTRSARGARRPPGVPPIPTLTVLCHPDPERVGERVCLTDLISGDSVTLSRKQPEFVSPRGGTPRGLEDAYLSLRRPFRLSPTSAGGVEIDAGTAAAGNRSRRLLVGEDPLEGCRVLSPDEVERGVVLVLACRIALLLHLAEPKFDGKEDLGMIGESDVLVRVRQEIREVADLSFPVLLRGESGTGKELAARAIHQAGPRRDETFLAVNVGAIPRELAAAQLFGSVKGAFTGATRNQTGYFERARGGTLFLDEIGESPPEVQVPLLRVLDTGEIQPVGAKSPLTVDVRVITATEANLEAAVRTGEFRAPLLFRLSSYEIELPPLRERREDFGRLFYHFLKQELDEIGEAKLLDPAPHEWPWVPAELVSRLAAYEWPGNVRELLNVVRKLVVRGRKRPQMELPGRLERLLQKTPTPTPAAPPRTSYRSPHEVSVEELLDALRVEKWNLTHTAARLRLSRTSLYRLMAESQVGNASRLGREEILDARERCGNHLNKMAAALNVSPRGLLLRMKDLGLK